MAAVASSAPIPGPAPSRLFGWRGNMLRFFRDPIPYMRDAYSQYGTVVSFTEGGSKNLIITIDDCKGSYFAFGPSCNQAVLTQANIFQSTPIATTRLNHPPTTRLLSGIFSMNGDKHRQQRRLMMPAFHKKRIESYCDDMTASTQRMLDQWQIGSERNIYHDFVALTLEIACKTLFGVDIRQENREDNIGRMIEKWIMMNMNPAVMLKLDVPGMPYHRFARAGERLDAELRRILTQKRESGVDQGDVLSMLIQMRDENGDQVTEDELIGQANIMFFAAHETTATTMSWIMFLVLQHPEVYAALLSELDNTLHGKPPTVDQLMALPVLDRVIKESMRVLPPVSFLLRVTTEDTELDGHFIPANSEIMYSPFITHHMPHLYADPERFNPDRWLTIDPNAYEYIPFGAGIRMCIGAPFAMIEMKIILSMLLQRYHVAFKPEMVMDYETKVTTAPKGGLPVTVQAQEGKPLVPGRVTGSVRTLVDLPS